MHLVYKRDKYKNTEHMTVEQLEEMNEFFHQLSNKVLCGIVYKINHIVFRLWKGIRFVDERYTFWDEASVNLARQKYPGYFIELYSF